MNDLSEQRAVSEAIATEDGFFESARQCETCLNPLWVKVNKKPFRWQSDVDVITFRYRCLTCGTEWVEHDSD